VPSAVTTTLPYRSIRFTKPVKQSPTNQVKGMLSPKEFCSVRLCRISQIHGSFAKRILLGPGKPDLANSTKDRFSGLVKRMKPAASVMCLSPVEFSAQTHLTSELLRFL
jgi:hypothetical protein